MSEVRIKNFKRVLVANRGEIAIRVFRALNELGITSVAVYSKEDKYAMFRTLADEAYPLNPEKGPIDAYLDIPTILKIAKDHNVDAIHPGYGFLAENPVLVEECEKNGITFIGPTVDSMNAMGDKISSKQIAIASQVPIIPGRGPRHEDRGGSHGGGQEGRLSRDAESLQRRRRPGHADRLPGRGYAQGVQGGH